LTDDPNQINLSPYQYGWNNPANLTDPDGNCPLCAVAGGFIGGVVGGVVEMGSQLLDKGTVDNWDAVKGSAAQGAITGAVAGLTGGAGLLVNVGAAAGANVVGGAVSRDMQGLATTVGDVAKDAAWGAGFGTAGHVVGKVVSSTTNGLSNAAKGKLGEGVTEAKYAMKGYKSDGKAKVKTGGTTKTGKDEVALYDHKMKNVITGKELTVESKFGTSGPTPNQVKAASNVQTPGGVIYDRTTSNQIGNTANSVVTGSAGQVKRDKQ
jgi:hypothetical protein